MNLGHNNNRHVIKHVTLKFKGECYFESNSNLSSEDEKKKKLRKICRTKKMEVRMSTWTD